MPECIAKAEVYLEYADKSMNFLKLFISLIHYNDDLSVVNSDIAFRLLLDVLPSCILKYFADFQNIFRAFSFFFTFLVDICWFLTGQSSNLVPRAYLNIFWPIHGLQTFRMKIDEQGLIWMKIDENG